VHLLEAEDADWATLLPRSRIVGANADALERIEVADFIGDRILGHRRERTENADGAGGASTFVRQHVVDQGEVWRRRSSCIGRRRACSWATHRG
jgi:hypothetical protein